MKEGLLERKSLLWFTPQLVALQCTRTSDAAYGPNFKLDALFSNLERVCTTLIQARTSGNEIMTRWLVYVLRGGQMFCCKSEPYDNIRIMWTASEIANEVVGQFVVTYLITTLLSTN